MLASYPGPTARKRKGRGIHCLRMRLISQKSWEQPRRQIVYYRYVFRAAFLSNDGVRRLSALPWPSVAKYSCKCLQPAQVASISAVCTKKTILHGSPTEVWTSVCYEGLPFVVNCKLARIAGNPGQYSASCCVVLVISWARSILFW